MRRLGNRHARAEVRGSLRRVYSEKGDAVSYQGNSGETRRSFLSKAALLAGAAAVGPVVGVERARGATAPAAHGVGKGRLGLVGTDHVGITVPDLNQAIEWFE